MAEDANMEISRLREQMHLLYARDNKFSEDLLHISQILDKHIFEHIKANLK